uniref:Uncharacterized protein n=1 Tax=Cyprinus carpio TaxID=7962 RepID=A0A8C1SDS8_CYPCA
MSKISLKYIPNHNYFIFWHTRITRILRFSSRDFLRITSSLMPTVKYTAGSLMLWAYFSAGGPGHLIMGHGWIFHQDNDLKQTAKSTQKCLTEHKIKLLPWPSQSPDLKQLQT